MELLGLPRYLAIQLSAISITTAAPGTSAASALPPADLSLAAAEVAEGPRRPRRGAANSARPGCPG